jgi:hypothetical protein
MSEAIRILTVVRDGDDGLIVTFSDGTTAGYLSDELLELRPHREPTENPKASKKRANGLVSTKLHKAGELLKYGAVLESGALRGMEREANCDVLARKQSSDLDSDYAWASIVNAPAELPDGEYLVMFDRHTVQVAKARDQWLCFGAIARMSN